jgi:hypothetical protein
VTKYLKKAYLNEQEHYQSVAGILSGSGNTPAVSADVNFRYPSGTFESQSSILKAAVQLENLMIGTYVGALGGIQGNQFKSGIASILASEAQHGSYFTSMSGGLAFSLSFPPALTMQQASDAMAGYTA